MSEVNDDARNAVVQRLSTHFADDRITMDELERRLDLVYKARLASELAALTADLPTPVAVATGQSSTPLATGAYAVLPYQLRTFMGNIEREGALQVSAHVELRAVMGNIELDLRDAHFGAFTEISIKTIMGNVEIVLPSGVRVENDGGAFLGSFVCDIFSGAMPMVGTSPVVRFTGKAVLGNVEIRAAATQHGHGAYAAVGPAAY